MNDSLDVNKIAAATLTTLITRAFNSVSEKAAGFAKDAWSKIFEDFAPFMRESHQKNAYVRLLSQKDTDVELYNVYVNSAFTCGSQAVDDEKLIHNINEGRNVVINGNGGAGKTFFMRHLWMTLFKTGGSLTPIFIELRKLNDLTSIDLKSYIRLSISRKKELDNDVFSYFCETGRFCFILDGFDEISQLQRDSMQRQILQLSSDYPDCRFVVSSRYERRFAGWQNFDLYESQPFDLPKVKKLVELVPFDTSAKKLFQKQLDQEFYERNRSFLSNPLLAIMMMMTFKENMDIPRRMNIFYDQAFTTLYQWHDATKAFNREKTLDIYEFQCSFGMFCLLSYHQEKFEFTKSEVIDLINKSNKICGIKKDPENILRDYEETVNLLKQEGLKYVFIHRSFQEYFCAYAIMRINPGKFKEIFSSMRRRFDDSVLLMCFEMNDGIVIDEYISQVYDKFKDAGLFKPNTENKFDILNRLGVYYSAHIATSPKQIMQTRLSMSVQLDEFAEEFFNNINKLMGYKSNGMSYCASILFHSDVVNTLHNAARGVKYDCQFDSHIRFEPKSLSCEITFLTDDIPDTATNPEKVRKSAEAALLKQEAGFAKTELKLREEIERIRKWCLKEIEKNAKREKSLDTILGL